MVKQLLKKHGFVERKMQKAVAMKTCKDRNEQFEKIHRLINEYKESKNPIISIDAKKKKQYRLSQNSNQFYNWVMGNIDFKVR